MKHTTTARRDAFEARRAEEARVWLAHPDRRIEDIIDRERRTAIDRALGHTLACGLLACAPGCTYTAARSASLRAAKLAASKKSESR